MATKPIKKIVIAGGGTAGWMTASHLSYVLKKHAIEIVVIESSEIGTVGVGEATIPTIKEFYRNLGIRDRDVFEHTNATVKLGIEFLDWNKQGTTFIHPFGGFGIGLNNIPFIHYWLKYAEESTGADIEEFSIGASLARNDQIKFPVRAPNSPLDIFEWALHIDATKFAELLRSYACEKGVTRIDAKIDRAELNMENGEISELHLCDGRKVEADLFVDCTGFRSLLLGEALNVGFDSWQHWLFCDRAVAVQSEIEGEPKARTVSEAHTSGWGWKIPLQHRQGNGIVYSSNYMTGESATNALVNNISSGLTSEPKKFSFVPGKRAVGWYKNCVGVGLSTGFLEPLESTSIALIQTAVERIGVSVQHGSYSVGQVKKYNDVMNQEVERIRDFIIAHYKFNQRVGEPFWDACREADIPDTLCEKYKRYKSHADLSRLPWEIFGPDSWLAVFEGLKNRPNNYSPNLLSVSRIEVNELMAKMKSYINTQRQISVTHKAFLNNIDAMLEGAEK